MPKTTQRSRPSPARAAAHDLAGLAAIHAYFAHRGWVPWDFQHRTWDAFVQGHSGLLTVATGAGKTFAATLGPIAAIIDRVANQRSTTAHPAPPPAAPWLIYLSPLKSVARDVEHALREPLVWIAASPAIVGSRTAAAARAIRIESRTGDTTSAARARQKARMPEVLVTTPESLCLLLSREDAPASLSGLLAVVVDEWHELISSKRGTQVELALATLRRFAPSLTTWGMSATIANLDHACAALVGLDAPGGQPRPHRIITGDMDRPVTIDSVLPRDPRTLPWAGHLGLSMLPAVLAELDPATPTIVFTNTRSQAERWFSAIMAARPELESVSALHHGSLDRDDRATIEAGLKRGTIRIVVATSSLDLGVDFDPIERVIQIGSPKGVSRLIQRAGRASHRPRAACRISCVPTHALELIEIAAARDGAHRGMIEARESPAKPLDVLAQHIVTRALGGGFRPDDLFSEVRTSLAFRDLTHTEFNWALALVREGGGTLKAYAEYHKVHPDDDGVYRGTQGRIATLHRLNIGTIVGDSTLDIRYLSGKSLGRIEEGFVAHLREGQRFTFAGRVLRFVRLHDLVCYVRADSGSAALTPIWSGTRLPISESLAQSIRETLHRAALEPSWCPEITAAAPLLDVQRRESLIPAAHETLVEICATREGTHLFLFPFEGRLVNAGLGALLALRLTRRAKATLTIAANDYGVEILCPEPFDFASYLAAPESFFTRDNLAADALASANLSQLAKLQFREIARVSGLVFQSYPGAHKSGKQVQASSSLIFDVLRDFDPGHLLLEQARREVLDRHFEHGRLGRTLDRLAATTLRIINVPRPTPLSFPLVIERQSARLTSETIGDRVRRMREQWEADTATAQPSSTRTADSPPSDPPRSTRRPKPSARQARTT